MNSYNFTLLLRPYYTSFSDSLYFINSLGNKLFEAGCDDTLLSCSEGVWELEFDREASCLEEAIRSAISDVNKTDISVLAVIV